MPSRLGVALALAAGLVPAALGEPQVFHAGTDVVLLNVSTLDAKSRPVGGLTRDSFLVFEDGVPQDIMVFSHDPQPIALSVLLDTSVSMEAKLPVAQQAAIGFVERLGPRDIAQVIDFDTKVRVTQAFTSDHKTLAQAIRKTEAGGRTSLYDAVYIALDQLNRAPAPEGDTTRRQAIVLLTDGEDTSSHKEYEEVMDLSRRSNVIVFSIGLRTRGDSPQSGWNEAEFVLRTLATETGGRAFFVSDITQLAGIYGQIADELSGQYTLGYRSKNQKHDGLWRRVAVQLPNGGATALTKSGYFASSKDR